MSGEEKDQPKPAEAVVGAEHEQDAFLASAATASIQVASPAEITDAKRMTHMTRRSLIWTVFYFGGVAAFIRWLNGAGLNIKVGRLARLRYHDAPDLDGTALHLRKGLEFNERVWERLYSPDRRVPEYDASRITPERMNETIGMEDELDLTKWRLVVEGVHGRNKPVFLTMKDILAMAPMEMTTEFFCIEGWSVVQKWKGVAIREFMEHFPPITKSGAAPDLIHAPHDLVPYVLMTTPNDGYYVGLDMASAIHVQTMLCYEMNGKPLTEEHGAPLRLVIPVKYGVKNIKRIGKIRFTSKRPKDYWEEQGYDWFAGV